MKPLNVASGLLFAVALGVWASQHPVALDRSASIGIAAIAR